MPAQFTEDDVRSTFTYPAGYRPKPVVDQIARLHERFSEFKDASYHTTKRCPRGRSLRAPRNGSPSRAGI
jgi:hypothetical protein